jgi:thymidylate kinase
MIIKTEEGYIFNFNPLFYNIDSIINALSEISDDFHTRMESASGYRSLASEKYMKVFIVQKDTNNKNVRKQIIRFLTRALKDEDNSPC